MIRPTASDIGCTVVYRGRHPNSEPEYGVLISFSERTAFVRYGPPGTTSAATRFADLEWVPRRDERGREIVR